MKPWWIVVTLAVCVVAAYAGDRLAQAGVRHVPIQRPVEAPIAPYALWWLDAVPRCETLLARGVRCNRGA